MPRAHDDCKFRDEWLVQYKYKDWVVKDGDPRLARCQFCMKSSKFHHPWTMPMPWPCMIASNANSRMNSLLLVSWGIEKVIDGELVFEVKSLSNLSSLRLFS